MMEDFINEEYSKTNTVFSNPTSFGRNMNKHKSLNSHGYFYLHLNIHSIT